MFTYFALKSCFSHNCHLETDNISAKYLSIAHERHVFDILSVELLFEIIVFIMLLLGYIHVDLIILHDAIIT